MPDVEPDIRNSNKMPKFDIDNEVQGEEEEKRDLRRSTGDVCHVYKSMSLKEPKYLSELLHQKECSRSTRSAYQQLLQVPRSRTEIFTRAFQICASTIWNNLPLSLRLQPSLSSFKKGLKTHYFNIAYSH